MNLQTIFTKVKDHLLKQNKKCFEEGVGERCMYRQGELSCAVGVLIPDEVYHSKMEHQPVDILLEENKGFKDLFEFESYDMITSIDCQKVELLKELQEIHDEDYVWDWEIQLKKLAKEFDLDW